MTDVENKPQDSQLNRPKPVVLTILDGWGVAPDSVGNAISLADTPNYDSFCSKYFCTTLQASGESVGLPFGEMGNSEVGHLNIGAGKIVYQDLPRINKSISDNSFYENGVFKKAFENVEKNNSNLHLIGLLSTGGVHSSLDHLHALLELCQQKNQKKVFLHLILDGRDMAYNSGKKLVQGLEKTISELGIGTIASLSGRFYAMDRDNHWERTEIAYNNMVIGDSKEKFSNPAEYIQSRYDQKNYDEELLPASSENNPGIKNNDSVIFFNFRADRARQITKAFVLPGFEKFHRKEYLTDLYYVSMTQYDKSLPAEVAFPPEFVDTPLASVISQAGLKQLHIAETEKYAHVTYFFNGGIEKEFEGETRQLVPSPRVDSYADTPEMSAVEIKTHVVKAINEDKYDFIVINFANPDMVAHTGNMQATQKALTTVDKCLGEIASAVEESDGVLLVTADHGNAEGLVNYQSGEIDKEHSTTPVPLLIIGKQFKNTDESEKVDLSVLTPSGVLADIAPTVLNIMGLEKPAQMTGRSLI